MLILIVFHSQIVMLLGGWFDWLNVVRHVGGGRIFAQVEQCCYERLILAAETAFHATEDGAGLSFPFELEGSHAPQSRWIDGVKVFSDFARDFFQLKKDEIIFGALDAVQPPFGDGDGFDKVEFYGVGGFEGVPVIPEEGIEFFLVFAGHDGGLNVAAVFEGVAAGGLFAGGGFGAG